MFQEPIGPGSLSSWVGERTALLQTDPSSVTGKAVAVEMGCLRVRSLWPCLTSVMECSHQLLSQLAMHLGFSWPRHK